MSVGARNSSVMSNFCLDLSHVYTFHNYGCCTESSIKLGEILQKQKQKKRRINVCVKSGIPEPPVAGMGNFRNRNCIDY